MVAKTASAWVLTVCTAKQYSVWASRPIAKCAEIGYLVISATSRIQELRWLACKVGDRVSHSRNAPKRDYD